MQHVETGNLNNDEVKKRWALLGQSNDRPMTAQVRIGKVSKGKDTHSEGFDVFWKTYPRKTAKGDAERAWLKLNPTVEFQKKIIAAVEKAKQSEQWQRDAGRFIPYPATYLNGKRWEDEVKTDDYQPLIFDQ